MQKGAKNLENGQKTITFAAANKILIVLWCNGSTTGFGSVCGGSNPPRTTQGKFRKEFPFFFFLCFQACKIVRKFRCNRGFEGIEKCKIIGKNRILPF